MLGAYKYISFAPSDVTGPVFNSPAAGTVGTFVVGRSLATFSSNVTFSAMTLKITMLLLLNLLLHCQA